MYSSDGLKSSIVAALSLSVSGSGVGLTHSDIGGYTSFPNLGIVRQAYFALSIISLTFKVTLKLKTYLSPLESNSHFAINSTITNF